MHECNILLTGRWNNGQARIFTACTRGQIGVHTSHSSSGIELELRIPALSLAFRGIPIGVGPDNFIFAVFSDHHCVLVILIHSLVSDLPYRAFLNSRVNSSGFDVSILAISNLLWLFFHWYNFLLALKLVLIVFNEWKA